MKKIVPFNVFGNETDYLTLSIKDIMTIETITRKSIIDIWNDLVNSKYTLTDLISCLIVAYNDCLVKREEKPLTTESFAQKLEFAFENGASIQSFSYPLAQAILDVGLFGKKQTAARQEQTEQQ